MDLLELLVALINKHDSDWEATFTKEARIHFTRDDLSKQRARMEARVVEDFKVLEMMGIQYYDEEGIPYFNSLEH